MSALIGCRLGKLNLIQETALEGLIEIGGEVGGGNHNAIEILQFLQNDILDGILHLIDGFLGIGIAFAQDGIRLVE